MHLQDWGIVAASADAKPSASVTPGYPTNGSPPGTSPTVLDAAYLAVLISELYAAVDEFGTPDRADDEQLAAILAARIHGILGDASDTGSVTTAHLRAVIASTTSQASGAESLVGASDDMAATGVNSVALGSDGNGSLQSVAALRSLVAASLSCGTAGSGGREAVVLGSELSSTSATARAASVLSALYALVTGTRGAVIASEGTSGVSVGVTGTNSATVASLRTDGSTDAGGAQSLVAACEDSAISGGTEVALIAAEDCTVTGGGQGAIIGADTSTMSTGANMAVIAASDCDNRGASQTAMIGSTGCFVSASSNALLLGSVNTELYNYTNGFGGGWDTTPISFSGAKQNLKLWFSTENGTGVASAGFSTGTADFAEYMRIADYIEPGRLVALYQHGGEMLCEPAQPGDDVVGIISAAPAFLGNDDELTSADGLRRKDLPNEWGIVAMMGQLPLTVDETVGVGDYIEAGTDGIGTRSELRTNIRVLKKLGTDVAQVLIR